MTELSALYSSIAYIFGWINARLDKVGILFDEDMQMDIKNAVN